MCGVKLDVSDLVAVHVIFHQQWPRRPQIIQCYQAIGCAHCTVQTSAIKSDCCQLCVSLQHQSNSQWYVQQPKMAQMMQRYKAVVSAHCTVQTGVINSDCCQLCVSLQHQQQQSMIHSPGGS